MDGESSQAPAQEQKQLGKALRWSFLLLNIGLMAIGNCAILLGRVYFLHGGKRLWLASLVNFCGWPIALVPLLVSYVQRRSRIRPQKVKIFLVTPRILAACCVLGVATGGCGYLWSVGTKYLPVSTLSILGSTQLGFTAVFAFFVVKQRFTSYSINGVVLLLCGAVILGLKSGGERPAGESNALYVLGFFMILGASALYGLVLPLTELMYLRIRQKITYTLVMEIQVWMAIFSTLFCIVGMIVNNDFQVIPREARDFGLGEAKYYGVLAATAILWQIFNLGILFVISCSSSLLAGVVTAVLLPIIEALAVIFLHEKFDSSKGLSLFLCLWGFASYFYGDWKQHKKSKTTPVELQLPVSP